MNLENQVTNLQDEVTQVEKECRDFRLDRQEALNVLGQKEREIQDLEVQINKSSEDLKQLRHDKDEEWKSHQRMRFSLEKTNKESSSLREKHAKEELKTQELQKSRGVLEAQVKDKDSSLHRLMQKINENEETVRRSETKEAHREQQLKDKEKEILRLKEDKQNMARDIECLQDKVAKLDRDCERKTSEYSSAFGSWKHEMGKRQKAEEHSGALQHKLKEYQVRQKHAPAGHTASNFGRCSLQ